MNRLDNVFDGAGRTALIAYVTVGYPTVEATLQLVPRLVESGCDVVELGIPFSDPLADGATIQKASHVALENGVNPGVCLDVARTLRTRMEAPLVFMSYYNPILHRGVESFCRECGKVGIDGLIVPDLPPDEGEALESAAREQDVSLIYLLAPTSTDDRIRLAAEHSTGFLYLVSLAGVTGARTELPEGLEAFVDRVRAVAKQPLCVGFGISSPVQAARIASIADGVIVGSRILQLAEEDPTLATVATFVRGLRAAIDGAGS